jgi:hypothetical protein
MPLISSQPPGDSGFEEAGAQALEALYNGIVKDIQGLLDRRYKWPGDEESRIEDMLVRLRVWGFEIDIKSGTLEWLLRDCSDEAKAIKTHLDLVRSSLDDFVYFISCEMHDENSLMLTPHALEGDLASPKPDGEIRLDTSAYTRSRGLRLKSGS